MWTATCVHNNFSRDKKEKGWRNTDSTKYVVWSWRLLFWSSASSTWFVKNSLYFVLSCFPFWCFQPGLLVTSWVVDFFSSARCVLFLCSWTLVEICFVQNPLWGDLVARFDVTPAQVAALFGVLGSGLGAAGTGVGIAAVIFLFSDHHWWHQG